MIPTPPVKRPSSSLPSGPMKKKVKTSDGRIVSKWVNVPASKQEAVAELDKKDAAIKGMNTKKINVELKLAQAYRDLEIMDRFTFLMGTMLVTEKNISTPESLGRELFMRIRPEIDVEDIWSFSKVLEDISGLDIETLEEEYQNSLVVSDGH